MTRVQVVIERPMTLADLERACREARAQGFTDDASVMMPTLFSTSLVISRAVPGYEQTGVDQ